MEAALIAPCGINCNICSSHLREKKKCPGCHTFVPVETRCVVINCKTIQTNQSGYCYECEKFPCRRIRQIDERYRRVGISNIENLELIREKGVSALIQLEEEKWKCPECGGVLANNNICYSCGYGNPGKIKEKYAGNITPEVLVAPCGINCNACGAYLAKKHDVRLRGIMTAYCEGCRPKGSFCVFSQLRCQLLMNGKVEYCYECNEYPCEKLVALNEKYAESFSISPIENLDYIREQGITEFLKKEAEKWKCPECGGVISSHDGICYNCSLDKLKIKRGMAPMKDLTDEELIAPCGMNCSVCQGYLAMKNDLLNQGAKIGYCDGCRVRRGRLCAFAKRCDLLKKGQVKYCCECDDFPCENLEPINKRYSENYHMSTIENLSYIKEHGMNEFLEREKEKWKCPECGGTISCHNGICFSCGVEKLKSLKKANFKW